MAGLGENIDGDAAVPSLAQLKQYSAALASPPRRSIVSYQAAANGRKVALRSPWAIQQVAASLYPASVRITDSGTAVQKKKKSIRLTPSVLECFCSLHERRSCVKIKHFRATKKPEIIIIKLVTRTRGLSLQGFSLVFIQCFQSLSETMMHKGLWAGAASFPDSGGHWIIHFSSFFVILPLFCSRVLSKCSSSSSALLEKRYTCQT